MMQSTHSPPCHMLAREPLFIPRPKQKHMSTRKVKMRGWKFSLILHYRFRWTSRPYTTNHLNRTTQQLPTNFLFEISLFSSRLFIFHPFFVQQRISMSMYEHAYLFNFEDSVGVLEKHSFEEKIIGNFFFELSG